jgi:hypothetical protein
MTQQAQRRRARLRAGWHFGVAIPSAGKRGKLTGTIPLERSTIVLRGDRLSLSRRERVQADRIARRLWPGLVPIPHGRPGGTHYWRG